jgi:hypothetical protein
MKPLLLAALTASVASPALAEGTCVGKVLLPPSESVHGERVLVSPAHAERAYVPAQVQRSRRAVLVRPARVERIVHAAVWRTERTYVAAPGPVRWERGADRYADVAERVLVQPGRYVWERRYAPTVSGPPQPGQTVVSPTGLVMCKVWCPARYETVMRHVRVGAGRPYAVRTTIQRPVLRRVLVQRGGTEVRRIPAEYRWIETSRLLAPAHWIVRRTAAQFGWRQVREMHDGGSAYAPVVCGGPLSRPAMARMQSSLAAAGYDPGPADGIGRPETYGALHRFQVDHRLAAGQVTVESARALGVIP